MKIYESINAIMSEMGAIGKDRKNQSQGFAYRGIDDVMNTLQPLLSKHKVFIVPEIAGHKREERVNAKGTTLLYSICTIRYKFYADDGSFVEAVVIGEGMDSGDKATNKAMAIAMKYACFQVFCIPTEDMKEADAVSQEVMSREPISDFKVKVIMDMVTETNTDLVEMLKFYKINELKEMTAEMAADCQSKLLAKPKVKKQG